jgi:hypothetical protein
VYSWEVLKIGTLARQSLRESGEATSAGVRTENTYHDEQIKKDEICGTPSVHGRDSFSPKKRKGTKTTQIKTVQIGFCGSEIHPVVAFCEHGYELEGFRNGAEFYKQRNYCQLPNQD